MLNNITFQHLAAMESQMREIEEEAKWHKHSATNILLQFKAEVKLAEDMVRSRKRESRKERK
jgi:hypothetical protein